MKILPKRIVKDSKREIDNLRCCNSNLIIKYIDSFDNENSAYIITEYCVSKCLF